MCALTAVLLFGDNCPEVICAANDYEQSVGRVFAAIRRIIESSPLLKSRARITNDRINVAGATISAIPSNYASAAGSNHVLAIFDELWAYNSERSRRLFDELVPPPTRRIAYRLTVTYAGFEGESELLEQLYQRGVQQRGVGPNLYAGDGMLMFWSHEPVAPWQTSEWIADMRRSLRPNQFSRMIENRFVTAESRFIDMELWDRCTDNSIGHMIADRTLPVWVGVDASTKHDSTALAAVTWSQRDQCVRLVTHKIFNPTLDDPTDFGFEIEETLLGWNRSFNLRSVWYDPYQMAASSQRLQRKGLRMREYPQTANNLTAMAENFFTLVKGGNFLVYPDREIRTAVLRAIASEGSRGWKITKEKQSHRIDIVVALAMAALACVKDQGKPGFDYTLSGFQPDHDDADDAKQSGRWRLAAYLQSEPNFRLW